MPGCSVGREVRLDGRPPRGLGGQRAARGDLHEVRRAGAVRVDVPGEVGNTLRFDVREERGREGDVCGRGPGVRATVLADDHRNVGLRVAGRHRRIAMVLVDDVVVRERRRVVEADATRPVVALHRHEVVRHAEAILLGSDDAHRVAHRRAERRVGRLVAAGLVGETEDHEARAREGGDEPLVHGVGAGRIRGRVGSGRAIGRDAGRLCVAVGRVLSDHRPVATERHQHVDARMRADGIDDARHRRRVLGWVVEPADELIAVHRERDPDEARLPARDQVRDDRLGRCAGRRHP